VNFAQRLGNINTIDDMDIQLRLATNYIEIGNASNLTILEINGNPSLESADQYSNTKVVEKIWQYIIQETFRD
jgi:hypothetical protein